MLHKIPSIEVKTLFAGFKVQYEKDTDKVMGKGHSHTFEFRPAFNRHPLG